MKYLLVLYFEGKPFDINKLAISTWNRNIYIDFMIITTNEWFKYWDEFLKINNFNRIKIICKNRLIDELLKTKILTNESYECLISIEKKNNSPRRIIPGLKPFLIKVYEDIFNGYDNFGWIDHDVILNPSFNPSYYIKDTNTCYKFRKDCGQLCFIKGSRHHSSINRYIRQRKTSFRYDETIFQRELKWTTNDNSKYLNRGYIGTGKTYFIFKNKLFDNENKELIFIVPEVWNTFVFKEIIPNNFCLKFKNEAIINLIGLS